MAVVVLNTKWRRLFCSTFHSSNQTLYLWKSINQVRGMIGHVHGMITSSVSTEMASIKIATEEGDNDKAALVIDKGSEEKTPDSSISWEKPPLGWIKVNVGSSFRSTPEKSAIIGAVIRDSNGLFLGGFSNILYDPSCSPICSFRAAEEGLKFAIYNGGGGGYHNIILETDNLEVIRIINKFLRSKYTRQEMFVKDRPGIRGERMNCVGRILCLTKGGGTFRFNHVFREGNRLIHNVVGKAVNDVAGHKTFKTLTEFEEYEPMLREVWEDDYRGKKYQRGEEKHRRTWRNYVPKIKS